MKTKKEKFALLYRIFIVIVSFIALYLNFKLFTFRMGMLYFTNISNLLVLIYFSVLVIFTIFKIKVNEDFHHIIKGMVTMAITLTMLVFNLALSGNLGPFENHMLECNLVHIVVPLLVIFDYIIFVDKGKLKKIYVLLWTPILFAYQIFASTYSLLGGRFLDGAKVPYPYMDATIYGPIGVLINLIGVLIIYIIYGLFIVYLDNNINKDKKEKKDK